MIPNVTRGSRMNGLMAYLVGPGRANEHENQRLVAGDDQVTFNVPVGTALDASNAFEISYVLDQPRSIHGTNVMVPEYARDEETQEFLRDDKGRKIRVGERHGEVWHCSLAVEAGYGKLDDEKWEKIAHEFVNRMGFVDPDGAKSSRWAAVHHGASKNGNDHIHLVVQMVREDGRKANVHNDFHRTQMVCRELEKEFGLPRLESAEVGRGLAGEKPAERARAGRQGASYSDKFELRRRLRAALATASTSEEYLRHAQDLGVRVAPSFARGSNTEVRGYKVSLVGRDEGTRAFWYAPSKLDSTLGWPDINVRFGEEGRATGNAYLASLHSSHADREDTKARLHGFSEAQIQHLVSHKTGPDTLANIYARLSVQLERNKPGQFAQLSETYARAAQGQGNARYAARMVQRFAAKDSTRGWLAVAKQAGRLGTVMAQGAMAQERQQLATNSTRLLAEVEQIVNSAAARIEKENLAHSGNQPAKTPDGPYRDWNTRHQPGTSTDHGHER